MTAQVIPRSPLRPPFAKVTVGVPGTYTDLYRAMEACDVAFVPKGDGNNSKARLLLPHIEFVKEACSPRICWVSNAELGYPNGCSVRQSFDALNEIGAVKLPEEAGPQVCCQCELPNGSSYLIYMDPINIPDHSDEPLVFRVGRAKSGRRWLGSADAWHATFYDADTLWIYGR